MTPETYYETRSYGTTGTPRVHRKWLSMSASSINCRALIPISTIGINRIDNGTVPGTSWIAFFANPRRRQ
jgi:hypothetical protein